MRGLILFLLSIVLFTFVRFAWRLVMRNVELSTRPAGTAPGASSRVPTKGELIACARCGTYVVTTSAQRAVRGGREFTFCSEECKRLSA